MAASETDLMSERERAVEWLLGRVNYERAAVFPYHERQLKLQRMRDLLARLGQPGAGLKIIHVAGTKGKGSTAAMIAAIVTAAGYRAGVFSSPHLDRIEERLAVAGEACSSAEFAALVNQLRPVVAAMDTEAITTGNSQDRPTFFEITTAMALVHFVARQVDLAVLEVGLGGRLDSTNVCQPVVSVITSISFDHTQQLGSTLREIAGEKAGIVRPGVPVVCGVSESEAQSVIARVAQQHGSRLIQAGRDFHYRYCNRSLDFEYAIAGQEHSLAAVALAMRGPHQASNAAVALATIAELRHQGWRIVQAAERQGLELVTLPGRVEFVPGEPNVVLDTAHNAASAQALVSTLKELAPSGRRTLILSISRDKDAPAIVRELVPHFDRILVTQYQENPRAIPVGDLAELVSVEMGGRASGLVEALATPGEAWVAACLAAGPGELVCIAGSFFLATEMRALVFASNASSKLDR